MFWRLHWNSQLEWFSFALAYFRLSFDWKMVKLRVMQRNTKKSFVKKTCVPSIKFKTSRFYWYQFCEFIIVARMISAFLLQHFSFEYTKKKIDYVLHKIDIIKFFFSLPPQIQAAKARTPAIMCRECINRSNLQICFNHSHLIVFSICATSV